MIEHRQSGFAFCGPRGFYGAPTPQIFATERDAKDFAAVWFPEVWALHEIVPVTVVGHPNHVGVAPKP